jgi:hypothetical protein
MHEPLLQRAAIKELHPAQITVGVRKVRQARAIVRCLIVESFPLVGK